MTEITKEAIEAVKPLCGPRYNICWTQDQRDAEAKEFVVLLRASEFESLKAYALSTLPIAGGAPEGWQLVPKEPTEAMMDEADHARALPESFIREVWSAMIAAAPVPPSSPGKDGGQEVEGVEKLCKALEPFARVAKEDIGDSEADSDFFMPMTANNRAPLLTVGDFREALAVLAEAKGSGQ